MSRAWLLVTCLAALPSAHAADAIDLDKLCPADQPGKAIDAVDLVYAALDSAGQAVSHRAFDANRDGNVTQRERVSAIVAADYCAGVGKPLCNESDAGALDEIRLRLQTAIGHGVVATRSSSPSPADVQQWPALADSEYGELAQMLDEDKGWFQLACAAAGAPKPAAKKSNESLRITGDIESLSLPRGGAKKLRAVTQAEVAYTNDDENDSETFQIAAFLGYDFARTAGRQFIPFVGYESDRTRKSGPDDDGTSKVSVGFLYAAELESLDRISLAPLYVADRIEDSRVFALRAAWTPGFLYGVEWLRPESAKPVGPVDVRMNLQLRAQAGRVIDAGTSTRLQATDNYARLGPAAKLEIWPNVGQGPLSHISADISYRHFFRLQGPDDVEWWSAGVNYAVGDNEHATLRWSYEQGEDEETLDKSDQWKLTFGVRF